MGHSWGCASEKRQSFTAESAEIAEKISVPDPCILPLTLSPFARSADHSDVIVSAILCVLSILCGEFPIPAERLPKIKGALREDPKTIDEWASKYPKNKTIIFYCA